VHPIWDPRHSTIEIGYAHLYPIYVSIASMNVTHELYKKKSKQRKIKRLLSHGQVKNISWGLCEIKNKEEEHYLRSKLKKERKNNKCILYHSPNDQMHPWMPLYTFTSMNLISLLMKMSFSLMMQISCFHDNGRMLILSNLMDEKRNYSTRPDRLL